MMASRVVTRLGTFHNGHCLLKTVTPASSLRVNSRNRSAKVAPSTSSRRRAAARSNVLSPAQVQRTEIAHQKLAPAIYGKTVEYYEQSSQLRGLSADEVQQFANELSQQLSQEADKQRPSDPRTLTKLLRHSKSLSPHGTLDLALYLVRQPNCAGAGWKLVLILAESGHIQATIVLLMGWLRQTALKPNVLQGDRVSREITRLQRFIRSTTHNVDEQPEQNVSKADALRVEAMLLTRLGNKEQALTSLEEAWRLMETAGFTAPPPPSNQQKDRLSDITNYGGSIWNDLYEAYAEAYQQAVSAKHQKRDAESQQVDLEPLLRNMQMVLQVGIDLDDATSHFNAAKFEQLQAADVGSISTGQAEANRRTSKWIHHMTRAAVSGVPEAAHELGMFYEQTISAESGASPLESGSSLPEESSKSPNGQTTSLLERTLTIFGLKSSSNENDQSLLAPVMPAQRLRLAHEWYTAGARLYFAPSQLALARLSLSNAASPNTSMPLLLDCLGAAQAQRSYLDIMRDGSSSAALLNYTSDMRVDKWRIFDHVFKQWVDDHSSYFEDMTAATANLCDTYKLDILDEDGGLLYKHT